MAVAQRDEIARNMQRKTTEELLDILVCNDRGQWSDMAFDVVRDVLKERPFMDKLATSIKYREDHLLGRLATDNIPAQMEDSPPQKLEVDNTSPRASVGAIIEKIKHYPLVGLSLAIAGGYVLAHLIIKTGDNLYEDNPDLLANLAIAAVAAAFLALVVWQRRSILNWLRNHKRAAQKPKSGE
jgi:hypothetical protein